MTARPGVERRREERRAASGQVQFQTDALRFTGRLADVSASGFRAIHRNSGLCAGQYVRFRHGYAEGVAQVVWNRVMNDSVESGFLILSGVE
jgi:hypothetical protein